MPSAITSRSSFCQAQDGFEHGRRRVLEAWPERKEWPILRMSMGRTASELREEKPRPEIVDGDADAELLQPVRAAIPPSGSVARPVSVISSTTWSGWVAGSVRMSRRLARVGELD